MRVLMRPFVIVMGIPILVATYLVASIVFLFSGNTSLSMRLRDPKWGRPRFTIEFKDSKPSWD